MSSSTPPASSSPKVEKDVGLPTSETRQKRKRAMIILTVIFAVIALIWFLYWLIWGRFEVYTDDAYVHQLADADKIIDMILKNNGPNLYMPMDDNHE